MKTTITIISLSAILACLTLSAQESPRPQISVEQRFKQWAKNGDGKVSVEELNMPNLFGRLDKDKDGFVSKEEFTAFFARRGVHRSNGPEASPERALVTQRCRDRDDQCDLPGEQALFTDS